MQIGLRPVRDLAAQVQTLAADTLDRRLDGSDQPEELAGLIHHVNELLRRLHRAYAQLEGFNADVAHELFTPLTTLIGGTEVAPCVKARDAIELRDDVLGGQLEELQRMSLIVQDMLFPFAGGSWRTGAARRRVQPRRRRNSGGRTARGGHGGGRLALARGGDARGAVDVRLLQRALEPDWQRHVTRTTGQRGGVRIQSVEDWVKLRVVNEGSTVAPDHLPRLFDRFYRVDTSRSGADRNHGLGLAIVAAIARMHGDASRPTPRGITSVGLDLPAVAAAAAERQWQLPGDVAPRPAQGRRSGASASARLSPPTGRRRARPSPARPAALALVRVRPLFAGSTR